MDMALPVNKVAERLHRTDTAPRKWPIVLFDTLKKVDSLMIRELDPVKGRRPDQLQPFLISAREEVVVGAVTGKTRRTVRRGGRRKGRYGVGNMSCRETWQIILRIP